MQFRTLEANDLETAVLPWALLMPFFHMSLYATIYMIGKFVAYRYGAIITMYLM